MRNDETHHSKRRNLEFEIGVVSIFKCFFCVSVISFFSHGVLSSFRMALFCLFVLCQALSVFSPGVFRSNSEKKELTRISDHIFVREHAEALVIND